jgi:hypothetical protein
LVRWLEEMSYDCGADALIDSPPGSEAGSPRLAFTSPTTTTTAGQATRPVQQTGSSFSDFLSSNQMAAATSPKLPKEQPPNRRSTFSLKRATASIIRFRSTKSKGKVNTLPNLPSPEVDEWGIAQPPRSAKF